VNVANITSIVNQPWLPRFNALDGFSAADHTYLLGCEDRLIHSSRSETSSGKLRIFLADFGLIFVRPKPNREKFGYCGHQIRLPEGTLPDGRHAPSLIKQRRANGSVPCNIRLELRLPEFRSGRRGSGVAAPCMAMPEAAIDEDGRPVFCHDQVRASRYAANMKPVPEAAPMQGPAKDHLWLRVFPPYPGHHSGTSSSVDDIRHLTPGLCC